MPQIIREIVQIQALQQHLYSLGSHLGDKLIRIFVVQMLIVRRQSIHNVQIFLFGQHVQLRNTLFSHKTRLNDDIALVVNNSIQFFGG